MRLISLLMLSFALFFTFSCTEKSDPEISEQLKNELRKDAKDFMETLKGVLVSEMQVNGITAAVSVCSDTAQTLTNNYGIKKGIYIKRVSFKNRNPNNVPDEFETKGLNYFQQLKNSGRLDESTELFEIEENEAVKSVLYLKPILIQAPCLGCHGQAESIPPDVKTIIDSNYPADKATGYKPDELRGAVSIRKTL